MSFNPLNRLPVWRLVVLLVVFAGCSGSQSDAGTIEFGLAQSHHVVKHPVHDFGPDDTFAYVAHVNLPTPLPSHSRITEYFVSVDSRGREHPVMTDSFKLSIPVRHYITLNSIRISKLYQVGFTAPGRYRVRLVSGSTQLAQGTFQLH